ncbi:MAG TPA: hypothetical protein DCG34_03870 [Clostridiales bacterium]|jgi:hypothetical protein|nr:hypothetical protein [Clostridiales bacterium]
MTTFNSYFIEDGVRIELIELKEELDDLLVERPDLKSGIELVKLCLDNKIHPEHVASALRTYCSITPSERNQIRSELEQDQTSRGESLKNGC